MVGAVPVSLALRDSFFAAGLGFLLCAMYSFLRFVLGRSKAALVLCDVLLLGAGALLVRSAAVSRFYSGLPRWYDLVACAAAFFLCRAALGPVLEKLRAALLRLARFPGRWVLEKGLRPAAKQLAARQKALREKKLAQKQEKSRQQQKKRLQNTGRVLYNSK